MEAIRHGLTRRAFLNCATAVALGSAIRGIGCAEATSDSAGSLFDGKTLDGWIQLENSAFSFSGNDIMDCAALTKKLMERSNAVSAFIADQLDQSAKDSLVTMTDPKAARSILAKELNKIILQRPLFERRRFQDAQLRAETKELLKQEPHDRNLVRANRMLLEDAFPTELAKSSPTGWIVKDGAMASTGSGRGVIYTASDYSHFRLTFTTRHISGNPDHPACVLIFCTRPQPLEIPLDALGGIQFQVPNGGHWDYRPGRNNQGEDRFTRLRKPGFDPHLWSRVEIIANAATGTAQMAVAQPVGRTPIEVLAFKDPSAGKAGPIAWQMHNAGLFDEFKDVAIETSPRRAFQT